MLEYILAGIGIVIVLIWMIRPLYNFFAKNKYVLLDNDDKSLKTRIKAGLPAFIFYLIILSYMIVPVMANNIVVSTASGAVILSQLIIIFVLTRYDKRQTKYKVKEDGIKYRRKFIKWDEEFDIKFKKTWLMFLHKPRFILRSKTTKIAIPMLSKKITPFIEALSKYNESEGSICNEIYQNTRSYYIDNIGLTKKLNKH